MSRQVCALACLVALLQTSGLLAHEVRPALLELTESGDSAGTRFKTLWKLPRTGDLTLRLSASFPSACDYAENSLPHALPSAFVFQGTLACEESLRGQTITIAGLEATLTDALVRIDFASGESFDALLRPSAPSLSVPEIHSVGIPAYLQLGFTHMLLGVDHLLFVLGLLLLILARRTSTAREMNRLGLDTATLLALAAAITSFTLAHSITLALAVLGHLSLPQAPVEVVIAMSIVLLASEVARDRGRSGILAHRPWQMAFAFGLLHGFGFAGALADIGLPQAQVGWALLLFNLGIEAGQLAFVACALGLFALFGGWVGGWAAQIPSRIRALPVLAMGTIACYWTLDRISLLM